MGGSKLVTLKLSFAITLPDVIDTLSSVNWKSFQVTMMHRSPRFSITLEILSIVTRCVEYEYSSVGESNAILARMCSHFFVVIIKVDLVRAIHYTEKPALSFAITSSGTS